MRRVPGYSLWLGHAGDVRDVRVLLSTGIVAVVDLAIQEAPALLTRELAYLRFPLVDGPGNPPWLLRTAVETVAGLLRNDIPTLVGCGAGLSRSPCIAGAAIARIRNCPADEGLAIALGCAPADVSPGFWADIRRTVG
jgi:protein-tyrosine phosphatase